MVFVEIKMEMMTTVMLTNVMTRRLGIHAMMITKSTLELREKIAYNSAQLRFLGIVNKNWEEQKIKVIRSYSN